MKYQTQRKQQGRHTGPKTESLIWSPIRVSECWGLTLYHQQWSFHGENKVGNLFSHFDDQIYEVNWGEICHRDHYPTLLEG